MISFLLFGLCGFATVAIFLICGFYLFRLLFWLIEFLDDLLP